METSDLINNISLLLGTQSVRYVSSASKDMVTTKDCRAVQILSNGFNINSLRLNYNHLRKNRRINLRRKTKLVSANRTLLLPVPMLDKSTLIKQIDDLDGPNILSIEFTTNIPISTDYIEGDGIVPIKFYGHTLYLNYNEESDNHNFKITPGIVVKNRIFQLMMKHSAHNPFHKYDYSKHSKIYKYKPLSFGDHDEHHTE